MILEAAILNVKPGQAPAFEAAMAAARPLIEASEGFQGLELRPCIEDHTEGFRGSERYQDWKAALHHFYQPFPSVDHYGAPLYTTGGNY